MSNEEMASQYRHLLCVRDSENTSLLANDSNISILFPPDTFMVITFASALKQALAYSSAALTAHMLLLLLDTKHR